MSLDFIDFHPHIYPEAIAAKAADNVRDFYGFGNKEIEGSAKKLLERGTLAGTHRFVILPVAVRPDRTRHINEFILSQVAEQPRFYGFGTVHAGQENLMDGQPYVTDTGILVMEVNAIAPHVAGASAQYDDKIGALRITL